MADNVTLPGSSGNFTTKTDEVSGAHVQIVKVAYGADGQAIVPETAPATETTLDAINDKVATETTLAAINTLTQQIQTLVSSINSKTPALNTDTAFADTPSVPVKFTTRRKFQPSFHKKIDNLILTGLADFDIISTGNGHLLSQSIGRLSMTSSMTSNQDTIIRSKTTMKGAISAKWGLAFSQRIAGDRFFIELTDVQGDLLACTVNSATSVTVTFPGGGPFVPTEEDIGQSMWLGGFVGVAGVTQRAVIASVAGNTATFTVTGFPASGSGTCSVWGRNTYSVEYSGTSNSTCFFEYITNGYGLTPRTLTTQVTTAHQMSLNVNNWSLSLSDRVADTTNSHTTRFHSDTRMIDSDLPLYLQVRVVNNVVAPASPTTMVLTTLEMDEYSPISMDITGMGPMSTSYKLQVAVESGQVSLGVGSNLIGDVGFAYRATTTGATLSATQIVSAASVNNANIKNQAGRVYGWEFANTTASWVYVCLHNSASAPTAGSGVVRKIGIPPNGKSEVDLIGGLPFSSGIGISIVSGAALNDATAVAANAVVGNLFWA